MKKFFYMAVAAIAALSSCNSDNDAILEDSVQSECDKVFTATIDDEADTRATLNDMTANWENTDKVSINGAVYRVTPDGSDATKATLTKESGDNPTDTYKAIYPASLSSGIGSNIVYRLPAIYQYEDVEGKFNMPMYAEGNSTDLSFKNLCGVVAVTVKNISSIKAVRITAEGNDWLSGEFTVGMDNGTTPLLSWPDEQGVASNQVTINCGNGVDAGSTGIVFYFPLPAANHTHLQIVVEYIENNEHKVAQMKTSGFISYRNKLYSTTFTAQSTNQSGDILDIYGRTKAGVVTKCATLWAGGPIFAKVNVGETEESGNNHQAYYWGYRTGIPNYYYNGTNYENGQLPAEFDNATKIWGSFWRMPTQDELADLYLNRGSDVSYDKVGSNYGFTIQGKTGYGSIFLPFASGSDQSKGNGYYWSATPDGSDNAYYLKLLHGPGSNGHNASLSSARNTKYFVRAVLQ